VLFGKEIDNRIESIIREKFTRVHPCVEWKFIQSSFDLLEKREVREDVHEVEPIVFKNVYPIYGQADIVGSSRLRNSSIQADFIDNLNKIEKVLLLSLQTISFQLLDHILIKVQNHLARIKRGINSSDESLIIDFIQYEIHPLFELLRRNHPSLKTAVKDYYVCLDENFGIVYRKRKAYEESVALLNETIGT